MLGEYKDYTSRLACFKTLIPSIHPLPCLNLVKGKLEESDSVNSRFGRQHLKGGTEDLKKVLGI